MSNPYRWNHPPTDAGEAIRRDSEKAPVGERAVEIVRLLDSQANGVLKSTAVAS
jgi:hypothetical protein